MLRLFVCFVHQARTNRLPPHCLNSTNPSGTDFLLLTSAFIPAFRTTPPSSGEGFLVHKTSRLPGPGGVLTGSKSRKGLSFHLTYHINSTHPAELSPPSKHRKHNPLLPFSVIFTKAHALTERSPRLQLRRHRPVQSGGGR